jgi:hypothetical protein
VSNLFGAGKLFAACFKLSKNKGGDLKPTSYLFVCEAVYLTGYPILLIALFPALEMCYRKPSWGFRNHTLNSFRLFASSLIFL